MQRINTSTAAADLHGAGKKGFTEGDEDNGILSTALSADIMNALQEEVANVIELNGDSLDENDNTQLFSAIKKIASGAAIIQATTDLINNTTTAFPVGTVVSTASFAAENDQGGAKWLKTAITGLTPSQSPAQLGDLQLSDADGNEWDLVFENTITLASIGGDIAGDNRLQVIAFNNNQNASSLDLGGKTWSSTSLNVDQDRELLQKNFLNGYFICTNNETTETVIRPKVGISDYEIDSTGTKSPILNWEKKRGLWLGTSIPHQGVNVDGYPEQFAQQLGCTVYNLAWSGSKASYDVYADPYDVNGDKFEVTTIKCLSMTEDDRLAGLALYGSSSVYDDSFDAINKASEMTVDFRIKNQFATHGAMDFVVLDHNHNDRRTTENYTKITKNITGITIGTTTDIAIDDAADIAIGDSIYLEIEGIDKLKYAAARVQNLVGTVVNLNIDSTAYFGTFVSGTLTRVDKNTIAGAWDFLIAYIKNMSYVYGDGSVVIILSSAPSYFTNGENPDFPIWSVGQAIWRVAQRWELAFFDIGHVLDMNYYLQATYFKDLVHALTAAQRKVLANHWVTWASGGALPNTNPNDYLAKGLGNNLHGAMPFYYKWDGKFACRSYFYSEDTPALIDDDFTVGLGAWTLAGTTVPSIVTAPWDAGLKAVLCPYTVGHPSTLKQTVAIGDDPVLEFDFYLPSVNITETSLTQVTLATLGAPSSCYSVGLLPTTSGTKLRVYKNATPGLGPLTNIAIPTIYLEAGRLYRITMDIIRSYLGEPGYILIALDDVPIYAGSIDNAALTGLNTVQLGVIYSNTGMDFDVYFANILAKSKTREDMTTRFTGTISPTETAVVVNGVIVSKI
jgi:hypothetical protein